MLNPSRGLSRLNSSCSWSLWWMLMLHHAHSQLLLRTRYIINITSMLRLLTVLRSHLWAFVSMCPLSMWAKEFIHGYKYHERGCRFFRQWEESAVYTQSSKSLSLRMHSDPNVCHQMFYFQFIYVMVSFNMVLSSNSYNWACTKSDYRYYTAMVKKTYF